MREDDRKDFFILNADDFGLTSAHNRAVLLGHKTGVLTSASLCSNGEAFDEAVNIAFEHKNLGLAVHLNIMEGKPLTECPLLVNKAGVFNKGYGWLLQKQFNKKVLGQIEAEFRAQIEKAIGRVKIDHLDSHVHTHGIPSIFEIVCKLAKEYNIPYVRTQFEVPYLVRSVKLKPVNFVKILLLNFFTLQNRRTLKKYGLKTNDNIIGVGYTGMMSADTVKGGLSAIKTLKAINFRGFMRSKNGKQDRSTLVAEALFHPCKYLDDCVKSDSHTREFEITQDLNIKNDIESLGFTFANYSSIS